MSMSPALRSTPRHSLGELLFPGSSKHSRRECTYGGFGKNCNSGVHTLVALEFGK